MSLLTQFPHRARVSTRVDTVTAGGQVTPTYAVTLEWPCDLQPAGDSETDRYGERHGERTFEAIGPARAGSNDITIPRDARLLIGARTFEVTGVYRPTESGIGTGFEHLDHLVVMLRELS
jgi:hypothetical protein